jgi:hypothetical protein
MLGLGTDIYIETLEDYDEVCNNISVSVPVSEPSHEDYTVLQHKIHLYYNYQNSVYEDIIVSYISLVGVLCS